MSSRSGDSVPAAYDFRLSSVPLVLSKLINVTSFSVHSLIASEDSEIWQAIIRHLPQLRTMFFDFDSLQNPLDLITFLVNHPRLEVLHFNQSQWVDVHDLESQVHSRDSDESGTPLNIGVHLRKLELEDNHRGVLSVLSTLRPPLPLQIVRINDPTDIALTARFLSSLSATLEDLTLRLIEPMDAEGEVAPELFCVSNC